MMDNSKNYTKTKVLLLAISRVVRPKHWIKNGFVLAPLFFAGLLLNGAAVSSAILAFVYFCFAASAAYIVNDIADREYDRQHSSKSKSRPIASGDLSIKYALILLVLMYMVLLSSVYFFANVALVLLTYIVLNLAYSYKLKYEPIADIFTVAIGFVLRIYAGALAIDVPVSSWMFVTVLCLALFLAAIKRLQELRQHTTETRTVLKFYSEKIVERFAEMSGTGALIFYSLFVLSESPNLVLTIPFVLYGLFRYWFISEMHHQGESPTDVLLADWQLALVIVLWGAMTFYLMMF